MQIVKRLFALWLALIVLMMTAACAEAPFLVHTQGWEWDKAPMEVLLKADVDTHMPFDEERLAMLTPITDQLSLRLVAGETEGLVSIDLAEKSLLSLQYRGNEAQLSSMPGITYRADTDPMSLLLGESTAVTDVYDLLHLSPRGESLLTDGMQLLADIPATFEENGRRSANTTNISGYGKAAYRIDYTIAATKVQDMQEKLLSICPEGWLREIIDGLTFSGKQTLRMYFTAEDVLLRAEYNGSCGPKDNLRTVKLVYKMRHDEEMDRDYLELTSPAKKGKNKNTLNFERIVQTDKKGARTITGDFSYTATVEDVTNITKGAFSLKNAFTDTADQVTGEVTFEYRLNGDDKYRALTLVPELTLGGTVDAPTLTGTVLLTEKYAKKVTEQALISIDCHASQPLVWEEHVDNVDLSALDAAGLAGVQQEVAASVATAIVRPLIVHMGAGAEWFFREMPADAVQSIVDAAGAQESQGGN